MSSMQNEVHSIVRMSCLAAAWCATLCACRALNAPEDRGTTAAVISQVETPAGSTNSGLPDMSQAPGQGEVREITTIAVESPTDDHDESQLVQWPFVRVDLHERVVDVDAMVGITSGWLEQVVCTIESRVHESVIITEARPSHIHAGLLLLGLEPGTPGSWKRSPVDAPRVPGSSSFVATPPTGPKILVTTIYNRDGKRVEEPVCRWIKDFHSGKLLPERPWTFGGSKIVRNDHGITGYAADFTGSIIGLVTFGDEVLGWAEVMPDREDVYAPEWLAHTEAMPKSGTRITLRLRPVPE